MLLFLLRCLACVAIFLLPFFLLVASSQDASIGILFIIPMIGLVPGLVMALLLFVPIELLTRRLGIGWLANLLVPIAGAVGAIVVIYLIAISTDDMEVMARNMAEDPQAFYFWPIAGAIWGIFWRFTALIGRFVGSRSKRASTPD